MKWQDDSWQNFPIKQQPEYSDADLKIVEQIKAQIKNYPGIVSQKTITNLRKSLSKVNERKAFILQGGDCAESFFSLNTQNLTSLFRLFLQMNSVLLESLKVPIVKIGRVAGQYAKPRSSNTEELDGVALPSFRGDIINGIDFTPEARKPDPNRIMQTYFHSITTYHFIQQLATGGFASFENILKWNEEFIATFNNERYNEIIFKINNHMIFLGSCGYSTANDGAVSKADFFTSHEALLLHYEEALIRQHNGKNYCLSADMLWIGDRTREINNAHIEFLRGVENPIGIKVGPSTDIDALHEIIKTLNPDNETGKIILIVRMGANKIAEKMPSIIEKITLSGQNVIWQIDPMHGNTIKLENNYKTRKVEDITKEIQLFFDIHKQCNTYAGGIHLEMTGNNVTECIGGMQNISDINIPEKYETYCDPRLNASQALQVMLDITH